MQLVGSHKKLGLGSDKDYRGFFLEGPRFERHVKIDGVDYDMWNKDYAVKQIQRGLNSCPLLYSCLFGSDYQVLTEEGQELIDKRDSFRSRKLIEGCLRFCDRKIKQSERPNSKLSAGKYVYYACSDMFEQIEILETGNCRYPLAFETDEFNIIMNAKENIKVDEAREYYRHLRNKIQNIKI